MVLSRRYTIWHRLADRLKLEPAGGAFTPRVSPLVQPVIDVGAEVKKIRHFVWTTAASASGWVVISGATPPVGKRWDVRAISFRNPIRTFNELAISTSGAYQCLWADYDTAKGSIVYWTGFLTIRTGDCVAVFVQTGITGTDIIDLWVEEYDFSGEE